MMDLFDREPWEHSERQCSNGKIGERDFKFCQSITELTGTLNVVRVYMR